MKKTIVAIICGIILLVAWFIVWQEYTKYQIRKTMAEAFLGTGNMFNKDQEEVTNTEDNSSEIIKDKNVDKEDKSKEKKTKKEVNANLKKWETKTFKWKYQWDEIEAEISLRDVVFVD